MSAKQEEENSTNNVTQIHVYYGFTHIKDFLYGLVKELANRLFSEKVQTSLLQDDSPQENHFIILLNITNDKINATGKNELGTSRTHKISMYHEMKLSNDVMDSKIGMDSFCKAVPFHVTFDHQMTITQLGSGLMKIIGPQIVAKGLQFDTYFEVVRPEIEMSHDAILSRIGATFELWCKASGATAATQVICSYLQVT
jgi:hypothetical protein